MKLVVQGLWHLGSVTAACCARHYDVVGLDFDASTVVALNQGKAPVAEPGLNELIVSGLAARKIEFTVDAKQACETAELLWLTYDTPVNNADESDVAFVVGAARRALPFLQAGAIVLISAQLPVGTCRLLEKEFPHLQFASSPENLRLGKAIDAFEKAERVIVGTRDERPRGALAGLFAPFARKVIFMRTESAEMVKHALNAFLALSVTFINEIAVLCEYTGADAREVSQGLKSEPRIGPRAYLGPGGAFAGGTLARDVVMLSKLGRESGERLLLIPAIKQSNDLHREWPLRRLIAKLGELRGRTIAILGLVYTPNTDTLRRSAAIELCYALLAAGATVHAYDPIIKQLPADLSTIALIQNADQALLQADAAVICTEWPEFRLIDWRHAIDGMREAFIIDANRYISTQVADIQGLDYVSVGSANSIS